MNARFPLPMVLAATFFLLTSFTATAQDSPASSRPARTIRPAHEWKRFAYTCGDGTPFNVYLHNQTIKIRYKDATHIMPQTGAASGARYSDGQLAWWSEGNIGFLQTDNPAGDGKMLLKNCVLDKPKNPAAPVQP